MNDKQKDTQSFQLILFKEYKSAQRSFFSKDENF